MTRFEARQATAFAGTFVATGIAPEPMPEWRERQVRAFLREMPEPVFWGTPLRWSLWAAAFVSVAVVAYSLGAAHEGVAVLGACR